MRHDAEALHAELAAAFADREHPGDDHIVNLRKGCGSEEPAEALEWLRGKTWQELLAEGMEMEHRDHVGFLRPEAWLYYFPALATFALDFNHPADMDETLLVRLAWTPQTVAPLLRPAERRAIVHFLEYLSDVHEARGGGHNVAEYALWAHWGPNPALQKAGDDPGDETDAT